RRRFEPELLGLRERDGNDPVFKGKSGVADPVVLYVYLLHAEDAGKVVGLYEGRITHAPSHGRVGVDGQELPVPPYVPVAPFDHVASENLFYLVVVVGRLEGTEARFTDV